MRFGMTTKERQDLNEYFCWRYTIRYAYLPTKVEEGCWVWLSNYYSYFNTGRYNLQLGEYKCMSLPVHITKRNLKPLSWSKWKHVISRNLKRSK